MDLPKFDEVIDNLYMPSQWGINLQGDSRIERFLHLCEIQSEKATTSGQIEHIAYGPEEPQGLDVLKCLQHNDQTIVLVFIHGGYWIEGDRHMYNFIANGLHAHNISVVTAGYRLATKAAEIEQCIGDVAAAIQKVQEVFPSNRIYLAGHSAGGHLLPSALLRLHSLKNISKMICISGIFSLSQIPFTSVGQELQFTFEQAEHFTVSGENICADQLEIEVLVAQFDAPGLQAAAHEFVGHLKSREATKSVVHHVIPNEDHFSLVENLFLKGSALAKWFAGCYLKDSIDATN